MSAFVSQKTGNWSDLTVWTQDGGAASRYPGTGDTVTILSGQVITCDVAVHIGTGTGNALVIGQGGNALTKLVVNQPLRVDGSIANVNDSGHWTYLDFGPGAGLEMSAVAGERPIVFSGYGFGPTWFRFFGTAQAGCYLRTDPNKPLASGKSLADESMFLGLSSTYPVYSEYTGSSGSSIGVRGSYVTISDVGDTTRFGVVCRNLWLGGEGESTRPTLDHATFLRSNLWVMASNTQFDAAAAGLILRDCKFRSSVLCHSNGYDLCAQFNGAAEDGSFRFEMERVSFDTPVYLEGIESGKDCVFQKSHVCHAYQHNFVHTWSGHLIASDQNGMGLSGGATLQSCYLLKYYSGNPHGVTPYEGTIIDGWVLDAPLDPPTGDLIMLGDGSGSSEVRYCVVPPTMYDSVHEMGPGKLVSMLTSTDTNVKISVHHNTGCVQGSEGGLVGLGENPGGDAPGCIPHCRDNIAWSDGTNPTGGELVLYDMKKTSANVDAALDVDYNGVFNGYLGTNWTSSTTQVNLSGYDGVKVSGTVLGNHDVHADPQFVDRTRNLIRWWREQVGATDPAYAAGQTPATDLPKAIAWLFEHPDQIATMITWVRAGYAPQNAAFANADPAGIGGNNTLGAMALYTPPVSQPIEIGRVLSGTTSIPQLHLYEHKFSESPSRWWQSISDRVDQMPVDPQSDNLMAPLVTGGQTIRLSFFASTAHGGNSGYQIPFNTIKGDGSDSILITPDQISFFYDSQLIESFRVPATPPPMGQENNPTNDYWTTIPDGGAADHHLFVIERNETTGGIAKLYEFYQIARPGPSSWTTSSARAWDLSVTPPSFHSATTAAGLPFFPFLARSEEVPDDIGHAIALAIPQGYGHRLFAWPALTGNQGGAPQGQGLPLGAKIRLKQSYYNAHLADHTGGGAAVFRAMRKYGLILTDWSGASGLWISGVTDDGWEQTELNTLQQIGSDAFEVVYAPRWMAYSGPSTINLGESITIAITHEPADDPETGQAGYEQVQVNNESPSLGSVRGTGTATLTPTRAGTYKYWLNPGGQYVFQEPFTFTVVDPNPATTYTLGITGSSHIGNPATVTVTPDHPYTGTITLTPFGCGLSTPVTLTFSDSSIAQTATFTPTQSGTLSVSGTNNGGLTNPAVVTKTFDNLHIIDTEQANLVCNVSGSSWYIANNPATDPGFFGANFAVLDDTLSSSASFPAAILTPGQSYQPRTTWPAQPNRPTAALWDVLDSDGTTVLATGTLDQTQTPAGVTAAGANWTALGSPVRPTGSTLTVRLRNSNQAGSYLVADAVYLESVAAPAGATTYTLTLSGGGQIGQAVTATVTPDQPWSGTITLTPSGCGLTTPLALTFTGSSTPQTATFTPTSAGTLTIAGANSTGLLDPSAATVTIAAPPATAYTLTLVEGTEIGERVRAVITPNGTATGNVTLSLAGCGLSGTVTIPFAGSAPVAAFLFPTIGPDTLTVTPANSGGLTDPTPATRAISTETIGGIKVHATMAGVFGQIL